MGVQEDSIGTLLADLVAEGFKSATDQLDAQEPCVDFRTGNAVLVVHLTNGKELRIPKEKDIQT
jgi:hypothetical protein